LVPPGDPLVLAQVLREVLRDDEKTAEMVHRAYETARSRFSREAMLEAVDEQVRRAAR
jgi:glycosyltransferase involved in cell wall biosynthesis